MAREEMLFSLQNHPKDVDYEDVYRIHQEAERKDRKIALIVCLCLAVICIVLLVVLQNISFLFYTIACVVVGIAYIKIPSNRKFIATTRLLIGEKQTVTFTPQSIYVEELYESDEAFGEAVDEEENEDAGITMKTSNMMAYENERGFLFADGKITNLFLYIAKRDLDEAQIGQLKEYANERCSRGYVILEMDSHIVDQDENEEEAMLAALSASRVDEREQYYGSKRLRLRDDEGKRVSLEDDDDIPDEDMDDDMTVFAMSDVDTDACSCEESDCDCDCDDCDLDECDCDFE